MPGITVRTQESMNDYPRQKIIELAIAIREKAENTTTLFLAMHETFPISVWEEAIEKGLLTPREFQAGILIVKQYRKMQARAAVKEALGE